MNTKPFYVNIPQEILDDLQLRLEHTRWPDELTNSGWEFGSNREYVKELTSYWIEKFDWRETEKQINAYPNFIAEINGYSIHYMHIKGKGKKSTPLIITHGWPGSFLEMMDIIPLLTEDTEHSFDLVIPSIPGFGFSGKPTERGCNTAVVAELWNELMLGLGYEKYGAQGGDIGAGISSRLALSFPAHVIGLHLNFIPGSYKPYIPEHEKKSEDLIAYEKTTVEWIASEGAYAHIHATKPLTAAYGLNDSPVGLCAWIIEKFFSWSDHPGNLERVFTKDQLLANVNLYWITATIHSSMRMYNESRKKPLEFGKDDFISVPVAVSQFPKEINMPPRSYVEKGYNVVRWFEHQQGGHFAAAEQPTLLAGDLKEFFLNFS